MQVGQVQIGAVSIAGAWPDRPRAAKLGWMEGSDLIPAAVRTEVESRLSGIERDEQVRILMAVESGSRAWGFPSPDSDFDIRFLYVRARDAYLSIDPPRDVIEQPIVDLVDLNGWDIRKALHLLLGSNATLCEWIESPIRYRADHPVIARLSALADGVFDPGRLMRHYASLAQRAAERWLGETGPVAVKRYFYALRPALAIRALIRDPSRRPPMNIRQLMARCDLPADVTATIERMIVAKSAMRESEMGTRAPQLDELIAISLIEAEASRPVPTPPGARAEADRLFLDLVNDPR